MTSFFKGFSIEAWILIFTVLLLIVAVGTYLEIKRHQKKPKPLVTIDEDNAFLAYKNIGDEAAVEIQTEEVILNLFTVFFKGLNLLKINDSKKVEARVAGRTNDAEYYLGACKDLGKETFPYFEGLNVHWFTLVTHYKNVGGKKYMSVVLVRCKSKKVEYKLSGPKWKISILDKFGLIRNLPKAPKKKYI